MRVLIAPDSFKGSLTSVAVAEALADGWRRGRPLDDIRLIPLADGGEGTLEAIKAMRSDWVELPAHARDPLGRPISATFLRRGAAGVVELASASGLFRLGAGELDPLRASTFGAGQVLAAAIGLGVRDVVLGLGGSATSDGGAGLLRALGARFLDERGLELADGGGALAQLARVDFVELAPILGEVRLTVASDVTNPLLGERGAAATYGPQKGADAAAVAALDAALTRYADVLEAASGRSIRDVPGAGAAGGTTAGLLAIADRFASFEVRPGVEVLMDLTDFDEALSTSDIVLTGEGRVDEQTAYGKTAMGVARRAHEARVRCLCFTGGADAAGIATLAAAGAIVVPVIERPMTVVEAMEAGVQPVNRAAERVARLLLSDARDPR
ncbi:MAG: glycerate kinase [Candidatus Limnocylindrales bacterium]